MYSLTNKFIIVVCKGLKNENNRKQPKQKFFLKKFPRQFFLKLCEKR